MTKSALSKTDLERAALVVLQSSGACEGIHGVGVEYVEDRPLQSNWRIATVERTAASITSASQKELRKTAQAIEAAQKKLRTIYSLRMHS